MMTESKLVSDSLMLIQKDLGLEEVPELSVENNPFEELHRFLTRQVKYWLDHDFGHLLNALYRIDISEKKVKEILQMSPPEKLSSEIAAAIIAREKQKVETRMKYSG